MHQPIAFEAAAGSLVGDFRLDAPTTLIAAHGTTASLAYHFGTKAHVEVELAAEPRHLVLERSRRRPRLLRRRRRLPRVRCCRGLALLELYLPPPRRVGDLRLAPLGLRLRLHLGRLIGLDGRLLGLDGCRLLAPLLTHLLFVGGARFLHLLACGFLPAAQRMQLRVHAHARLLGELLGELEPLEVKRGVALRHRVALQQQRWRLRPRLQQQRWRLRPRLQQQR